jgi:hypothetical protein
MPNLQPFGKLANRDAVTTRKALNRQQGLMLLGRKRYASGCLLTKAEEQAQLIAEGRNCLILLFRDRNPFVVNWLAL